jgi:hypothetical protein
MAQPPATRKEKQMPIDVADFLQEVALAYCDGIENHEDYAKWIAHKAAILYDFYVARPNA